MDSNCISRLRDAIALNRCDIITTEIASMDPDDVKSAAGDMLAHACRFGTTHSLQALLDNGLLTKVSPYYTSWINSILDNPFQSYQTDYYRCTILERRVVEITDRQQRIDMLRLLMDKHESRIYADELLFNAILAQDRDIINLLKSYDVRFTDNIRNTLFAIKDKKSRRWRRNVFCDLMSDSKRMYFEKFISIAEELRENDPDCKIPLTNGFIETYDRNIFESTIDIYTLLENFDFSGVKKIPFMLTHLDIRYFAMFEKLGWLSNKQNRNALIKETQSQNKTEETAYLLDFVNRTVDLEKERKNEERRTARELSASPNSIYSLQKIWSFKKSDANSSDFVITGYKQFAKDIIVPGMIGKHIITKIDDFALSYKKFKMDPLNVKSITISENITEIGANAMNSLRDLETVFLPRTLKKINNSVFYGCNSLTVINMHEGLEEIGFAAFVGTNLKQIIIPRSVTKIGKSAFDDETVLMVYKDSYAYQYCKQGNHPRFCIIAE